MDVDLLKLAIADSISSIYKGAVLSDREFLNVTKNYSKDPILSCFELNRLTPGYVTLEFPFVITRNKNAMRSLFHPNGKSEWTEVATKIVADAYDLMNSLKIRPVRNWSERVHAKLIHQVSKHLQNGYLKNHLKTELRITNCLKYSLLHQCNGYGKIINYLARVFLNKIPGFQHKLLDEITFSISKKISFQLSMVMKNIFNEVLNDRTSEYRFFCINTDQKKLQNKARVARITITMSSEYNDLDDIISNADTQIVV